MDKKTNKEKKNAVVKRPLFKPEELTIKSKDDYIWFEVFKSTEGGSETIAICLTLKEARKKLKFLQSTEEYKDIELHIDKWENKDNPAMKEEIE